MSIKQLNAAYLLNEDRILFRFNTQDKAEYRLWFTRRVTLFILAATSHLLTHKLEQAHSPEAAKALNEFEKQAILEAATDQNNANQTYESGIHFPLGFDPILVMDVTCAITKNDEYDDGLSIDFLLPGGANLNLKVTGKMMRAMCFLLDQLRQQASWGEALLTPKNDDEAAVKVESEKPRNTSFH